MKGTTLIWFIKRRSRGISVLAKKDSTITTKDKEIANKKAQIQSILSKKNATDAELKQAKALIASLNTDIEDYKAQVEVFKRTERCINPGEGSGYAGTK